ncbi:Peptide-N(4)-(N-acetyl-beta-glucosaminyl)asparagine amidase [Frankliniella fusca]|uniref:Peptide-N(4)-(N-acetyl-beta-glucosaminyl)asparagine amidase n=1 Tax=Frankliniella fusca TaxID=407009 RepID=A0AAE1I4T7_9NEOP|nr:Peptide-N(4)-(N-acetyl-beta-glucosaminyl)asparagine amidase [Frankliniella fusca]
MPPVVSATLLALEENPKELYQEVTSVLLRLASNVIKNPSDPKYRSIRLANPTVAKKLLPAVGAMECLFEMGFKEADDCLVLPKNSNLDKLKAIHDQILARRNSICSQSASAATPSSSSSSPIVSTVNATSQSSKLTTPLQQSAANSSQTKLVSSSVPSTASTVHTSEENTWKRKPQLPKSGFLERIISASNVVVIYSKKDDLEIAKTYIPLIKLETAALEQLREIQKNVKKVQGEKSENCPVEPSMQELILVQLLSWFKEKFFTWVNDPPCHFCSGKTKFRRTDTRDTLRVEVYECALCFQETEFPRHVDPLKLLETRRGRCGEWGRCFTFLCLSLGWDSRLVIDETDHVWTEVFITSQSRWVHCDPCENAFDSPLMYELGWKKKLTYILAYSPDDLQDVTWRYSANHKEVLKRRNICKESELLTTIMQQRKILQENLSQARKDYLRKRTLFELVELWKEPSDNDGNYHGRQSGSLAWRVSRGETSVTSEHEPYIWKPTKTELEKKEMHIQYLPGLDQYIRGPNSKIAPILGWQNGASKVNSLFRKEETDWKMVYLARKEGCQKGSISWSFDLSGSGLVVDSIKMSLASKIFETGQVDALVCGADCCVKIPTGNPDNSTSTTALSGASSIKLTIDLSGGNGNVAWQHAQLFRTEVGSSDVGLDFLIKLKPL